MGQWLTALCVCVAIEGVSASPADGEPAARLAASVLAYFQRQTGASMDAFLTQRRPPPLETAMRAYVVASLPTDGELRATPREMSKMAAANPVLQFQGRGGAITFKVIDVGHAFVGLHARSVLLASRDALALVSGDEFAALVAHEVAHEYMWDDYLKAMRRGDRTAMQEFELQCDGLAVITLRRLHVDPERLVSAVLKLTRYNERRRSVASADCYVPLDERIAFIRAVARLRWAGADGSVVRGSHRCCG